MTSSTRPVMLIGSGASLASPANLALFGDIRQALLSEVEGTIKRLDLPSTRVLARLRSVAPEVAFHSLRAAGVDVPGALVAAFDAARPQPNAVHEVVAHHLAAGGLAWTTNYDTLVERAWRMVTGDAGSPAGLVKPHGTFADDSTDSHWVDARGLLFARDEVLTPWTDDQREAFVAACGEAGALVVIGYSGSDVNARDAVRAALRSVGSVSWYERTPSPDQILERRTWMALRFPELDLDRVRWSDNPSQRFVDEQREPGWHLVAPQSCPVDRHRCDLGAFTRAGRDPQVVARLAVDAGEVELKRKVVAALVRREETSDADRRWARAQRRADARHRAFRLLWTLVKPIAARVPIPNPARSKARSTWVASHGLRSPTRARTIEAQLSRWLPGARTPSEHAAIQLDRSRALRIVGRFTDAVAAGRDAMSIAIHEAHGPTQAGQAEMETVEALRVLGRFDEALDAAAGRYDTLGLVHWYGWNAYEIGCTFIQLRRFDEAAIFIEHVTAFFAGSIDDETTAYDRSLGHAYSLLARAALRRLLLDLDGAEATLAEVARTRYREGREQIEVARQLQMAEVARARGDLGEARRLYRGLPTAWENYPTLSHLGLAYSSDRAADQQAHVDEAAAASSAQDSVFGLALCSQAAHDLDLRDPVDEGGAVGVRELRSRIFVDLTPDPARPIAFL